MPERGTPKMGAPDTGAPKRRFLAGTGWKMNHTVADTVRYAEAIAPLLPPQVTERVELFVLPPFTALHAAKAAFAGTPVGHGGQTMHWAESGAWTGEISAPMLVEAGCRYVALAHSERLAWFGETYDLVRRKVNTALAHGLTPILCLGEMADDKAEGRSDAVLTGQVDTALADVAPEAVPRVILAYEPRWAIGAAEAASPDYVAERHAALRQHVVRRFGVEVAEATRIIYGGSVTPENGPALAAQPHVDGLFVGRAAWTGEGLARIAAIVAEAARRKDGA